MSAGEQGAVGFVGLGTMGWPMAANVARGGHHVVGLDADAARAEAWVREHGGTVARGPEDLAGVQVVVTMLPDGKVVREAILHGGVADALPDGAVVVDMSSSEPWETRSLAPELATRGVVLLDAPVSGGVKRAADGTLAIMVGGDTATIDSMEAVLSAMGRSIFRTGKLGSGHAMKALNNYVSAAGLLAAVEAIDIGQKFGLDPNLMADILNASTGRNNTTEVKLKPFIISKAFNAGFPLKLMAKDVRTADSLAHAVGAPTPFADLCADLWDGASKSLGDKADHTAIGLFIEKMKS
jgi:3-hydroxyisobutyrate dehydrogenase